MPRETTTETAISSFTYRDALSQMLTAIRGLRGSMLMDGKPIGPRTKDAFRLLDKVEAQAGEILRRKTDGS